MPDTDNKRIIQHAFDELDAANSRALVDLLADDASWTVMGHTRWSGTYQGKERILRDLLGEYCFVYRLEGGKIREVTEYLDTELVTRVLVPPARS